jgi:predicted nucleic acid-binding protein
MGSSTLDELGRGERIFVDANVFIYHFTGLSADCRAFLERCETRDVEGVTSVVVLAEVAHRLMMIEALERGLVTPGQVSRKLRERPEVIEQLSRYEEQIERVPLFNIEVRAVEFGELLRAAETRRTGGLLVNDSLIVASARAANARNLASADGDFDRIDGLTRYGPTDLPY